VDLVREHPVAVVAGVTAAAAVGYAVGNAAAAAADERSADLAAALIKAEKKALQLTGQSARQKRQSRRSVAHEGASTLPHPHARSQRSRWLPSFAMLFHTTPSCSASSGCPCTIWPSPGAATCISTTPYCTYHAARTMHSSHMHLPTNPPPGLHTLLAQQHPVPESVNSTLESERVRVDTTVGNIEVLSVVQLPNSAEVQNECRGPKVWSAAGMSEVRVGFSWVCVLVADADRTRHT
jgi:hypothetical protein